MLPTNQILSEQIVETTYSNRTYRIVITNNEKTKGVLRIAMTTDAESEQEDRISGFVDNVDALAQAIYLILNTERYQFLIYSWDYGVELLDLFGKPMSYVISDLPRRIKDALIQDDRVEDVVDFEFEIKGKKLLTTFTVVSNIGNISTELEVVV